MLLYLGENPRRFLWCCFCILIFDLHFLVVLHLSMFFILLLFFIHIFFSTSSLTLPWIFTLSLHPFYTFKPSPSKSDSRHFHFQPFRYLLAVSATVLSGHFLPTGAFYLTLLYQHFKPAFIKASPGDGSSFLKFAELHTDPDLFVWFTVIHNLYIQNDSALNSTIYYHELLVVKV